MGYHTRMNVRKTIIIILFFAGLLLMAIFEWSLIWALGRTVSTPDLSFGRLNTILGFLCTSAGILLISWSVWVQYRVGKGTPAPMAATRKLVTIGPYAYTRNPMTLGAASFYLGISFWFGSLPVTLLVLFTFGVLLTYIYIHETKELSDRFGEEYLAYKEETPFLIPRFPTRSR